MRITFHAVEYIVFGACAVASKNILTDTRRMPRVDKVVFAKKAPAEKEKIIPFQQVFFIARLIPLQAGKLYIISE